MSSCSSSFDKRESHNFSMTGKWVFILTTLLRSSWGFNVDLKNVINAHGPSADVLFGYSLALNPKGSLYVGAPEHNQDGAILRCDFDGRRVDGEQSFCSIIDLPRQVNSAGEVNRDFLGAFVLTTARDKVVTCAPRARADRYSNPGSAIGSCYEYDPNRADLGLLEFYKMSKNPKGKRGWDLFTMMGTSGVMSVDDDLVVGAPMARANIFDFPDERQPGHVFKIDLQLGDIDFPATSDVLWGTKVRSTDEEPHTYDLTGSAMVKGRFFYDGKVNHYAVGAPKANKLRGRVYLCPDCFIDNSIVRTRISPGSVFFEKNSLELNGFNFGSRFGETLCAVDINNDGFDDLVVGAPLFSEASGKSDTGKVYVYKTVVKGYLTEMELITDDLPHDVQGSARFGSALASLGDLDQDGFEDFAVGAPFENNGAVYIYRGSSSFLFSEKPQKLTPGVLGRHTDFRGFGISISNAVDVDGNGHNDFAIGSMDADEVVIFRSLEVERINPESFHETQFSAVNPTHNEFAINITAALFQPSTRSLEVKVTFLNLDSRIELPWEYQSSNSTTQTMRPSLNRLTFPLLIKAKETDFGVDVNDLSVMPNPIRFYVQIDWSLSNQRCPQLGCPLLDPRSKAIETIQFKVPLQSGCQNSNHCRCNLEVINRINSAVKVVVGEDKLIGMRVVVTNSGDEPSHDTVLRIRAPIDLPLPRELECQKAPGGPNQEVQPSLTCRFPSLAPKATKEVIVSFDIRQWSSLTNLTDFDIVSTVDNECSARTQDASKNKDVKTPIRFQYQSKMSISAQRSDTNRQLTYNQTDVTFTHVYNIRNMGPSPTDKAFGYSIFLPNAPMVDFEVVKVEDKSCTMTNVGRFSTRLPDILAKGEDLVSCSLYQCLVYNCRLESGLLKGQEISVVIKVVFKASEARKKEEVNRYSVRTMMRETGFAEANDLAHDTTELFSVEVSQALQKTPYFSYALGVGIGLIMLALLVIALWKSNAFSKMRIFKTKLEDEQKGDSKAAADQDPRSE